MNNNDRLVRLRYALDIKDVDAVEIFKLGGMEVTKAEVKEIITKSNDFFEEGTEESETEIIESSRKLESFLNGFIIFKRGVEESKSEKSERPALALKDNESVNNIMLKKVKIALSLDSQDMIDIFEEAGIKISKSELGAIFRKEGHKHYKECGDKYARNFLKGLAMRYRK